MTEHIPSHIPSYRKMMFVPCQCGDATHFLRFTVDTDTPIAFWVDFVSTRSPSLWRRIKNALRYVFSRDELIYADIIIERAELERMLEEFGGGDA